VNRVVTEDRDAMHDSGRRVAAAWGVVLRAPIAPDGDHIFSSIENES
jgi:hypothetical protein